MARRYECLGRRLRSVLSRGMLKLQIEAAERKIGSSAPDNIGPFTQKQGATFSPLDALLERFTLLTSLGAKGIHSPDYKLASKRFEAVLPFPLDSGARFTSGVQRPSGIFLREYLHSSGSPSGRISGSILFSGSGPRASRIWHRRVSERAYSQQARPAETSFSRWTPHASQERSQSMLLYLLAMVIAVVGVTYASVPLYRRFCQATGYGGTVQRRETVEEKIARHGTEKTAAARDLVVHFNADVADSMPWKFTPCQNQVTTKIGQSTLAFYTAENTSSDEITGVSTYNVAPMQAGAYFNKIQCFCFEEQRLRPGERIDMPVLFYIDPEFGTDPKMDSINSLILSYTFFRVDDDDDE